MSDTIFPSMVPERNVRIIAASPQLSPPGGGGAYPVRAPDQGREPPNLLSAKKFAAAIGLFVSAGGFRAVCRLQNICLSGQDRLDQRQELPRLRLLGSALNSIESL